MHLENSILGIGSVVNFNTYENCKHDFITAGTAFINVSTSSLIFASDNSRLSVSIVLNISSSI